MCSLLIPFSVILRLLFVLLFMIILPFSFDDGRKHIRRRKNPDWTRCFLFGSRVRIGSIGWTRTSLWNDGRNTLTCSSQVDWSKRHPREGERRTSLRSRSSIRNDSRRMSYGLIASPHQYLWCSVTDQPAVRVLRSCLVLLAARLNRWWSFSWET